MLEWFPPTDVSEIANISLLATVVKDKATYWVKLQSMPLYNKVGYIVYKFNNYILLSKIIKTAN